jgi:hypothetical protein
MRVIGEAAARQMSVGEVAALIYEGARAGAGAGDGDARGGPRRGSGWSGVSRSSPSAGPSKPGSLPVMNGGRPAQCP